MKLAVNNTMCFSSIKGWAYVDETILPLLMFVGVFLRCKKRFSFKLEWGHEWFYKVCVWSDREGIKFPSFYYSIFVSDKHCKIYFYELPRTLG